MAYLNAPRLLRWFDPERVEARHAPFDFALRAELGPDVVTFVNESDEQWACVMEIGHQFNETLARAAFPLVPGGRATVAYSAFLPAAEHLALGADVPRSDVALEPRSTARLRSAAVARMWARCATPPLAETQT